MLERVIISAIAVNQILLGFLWLAIGMSVVFTPLFFLFGLWGMINAIALFFPGTISRITALAWHLLFVESIFIRLMETGSFPESQRLIGWWALIDLVSVACLLKVVFGYMQNRNQPRPLSR